jgi:hypothetical protein
MPPHQEGHRHSGSFASMPLQHHTPPDGLKNTGSGPLAGFLTVATTTTQCAEASPHPPLDSTSLSLPRRKHCERGLVTPAIVLHVPNLFRMSLSRCRAKMPRSLRSLANSQAIAAGRLCLVASPLH